MQAYKVTIFLLPDPTTGSYAVHIPFFPNCVTGGESAAEALRNAKEALELHLADATEDDLEDLRLFGFDHVVVGEIEVKVDTRAKATM